MIKIEYQQCIKFRELQKTIYNTLYGEFNNPINSQSKAIGNIYLHIIKEIRESIQSVYENQHYSALNELSFLENYIHKIVGD